jgi:pre-mRNA-processing factor 40
MEKVVSIFKAHNVDALTRWRDAQRMVTESVEWKEDTELRKLPQLDVLLAFEDFSRIKTNEYEAAVRKAEIEKAKRVRLGREGFRVRRLI